jgi:hypothetical protein
MTRCRHPWRSAGFIADVWVQRNEVVAEGEQQMAATIGTGTEAPVHPDAKMGLRVRITPYQVFLCSTAFSTTC